MIRRVTGTAIPENYLIWVCVLLLAFYGVVLLRTAWVSDDAYITFRTVDNFVNGTLGA